MATLVFTAFATANNALCNPDPISWAYLPVVPILFTIPALLVAIIVGLVIWSRSLDRFNSTDGKRSFGKSYLYALLSLYLVGLVLLAIYKFLGCRFTYQETKAYTQLSSLLGTGGIALLQKTDKGSLEKLEMLSQNLSK